jgi:hypothetical protein
MLLRTPLPKCCVMPHYAFDGGVDALLNPNQPARPGACVRACVWVCVWVGGWVGGWLWVCVGVCGVGVYVDSL